MATALTAQDKKWRAQDDARTLIQSKEIEADKSRLNLAIKEAGSIAEKAKKEANAAVKVSKRKVKKSKKK